MGKKIWLHKSSSIEEESSFNLQYYLKMSSSERLATVQLLREIAFKLGHGSYEKSRKRLRRSIRVIQTGRRRRKK